MQSQNLNNYSLRSEVGFAFKSLLVGIFFLALTVAVFLYIFGNVVRPGFLGVRQITFGPGQGFSEVGLQPGYHWTVPFYSKIHMVPKTVRILHLHRNKGKYQKSSGSLEVQTTDGATIDVDLSVLTRMYDRPAKGRGGPADLLKNVGITPEVWRNHVRRVCDDELRRALGKLSTGKFYDPFLREKQVQIAKDKAHERLNEFGISVEQVLLRRYTYRAQRIDDAIFRKNLQDQEERLNATKSGLAKVKAELEQVAAEWDAKIKSLNVEGENKASVIKSEGDLYEQEQKAFGDLRLAKAHAEVERLKAGVFASTEGAENYLAFKITPLLGSLKGGIVSDLDPYNLESWLERLGLDPSVDMHPANAAAQDAAAGSLVDSDTPEPPPVIKELSDVE